MSAVHRSSHARRALGAARAAASHPVRRVGLAAVLVLAALLSLAALLGPIGCGPAQDADPAAQSEIEDVVRFSFVRTQKALIRIDTATGMTWFVPTTGDGGWAPIGGAPATLGAPQEIGRFGIQTLGGRRQAQPDLNLLRVDRASGRSWLGVALDGAEWTEISDPDGAVSPAADTRPATVASATPTTPTSTPTPQATRRALKVIPRPVERDVLPKEKLGETPEERSDNLATVIKALEKEGMPVEIQVWAARQLSVFDAEQAVPPLLDALESPHPEVVIAAINSLQKTGRASTIPRILKLKGHSDPRVRAAVDAVIVEVR